MSGDGLLSLEELIRLLREAWPAKYTRGRILHIHRNSIRTDAGRIIHLRVLVQELPNELEGAHHD